MGISFTPEQQKVIDLRNRNILVSAAAGSGKTAVLVERIIARLTRDEHPINVDQLLVVTFTEAAALEMKERVRSAIEKVLEEQPENAHLQRQATLIHSAKVTTIHSFCLSVIRDYFHVIDLDPGFRIAEDGELHLLKNEVLSELLEQYYTGQTSEFKKFVETFAPGKDDKKIEEMILQLYEYTRGYPEPEEWLAACEDFYEVKTVAELEQTTFVSYIVDYVRRYLENAKEKLEFGIRLCEKAAGPYMYADTLESDLGMLERIMRADVFCGMCEAMQTVAWARMKVNRDASVSTELADQVKGIRDDVKKMVSDLVAQYFYDTPEHMVEDILEARSNMRVLAALVNDFATQFAEKKRSKNIIDFGDMERFALNILTTKENGKLVPSKTAEEYQDQFAEIMIDEYQDSNLIQEAILTSVSTVSKGGYNLFMVGDVKQSIYRFRLARPELFMEKFHTYSTADSEKQRIDLHKNFRSRREVLDSVNFLFEQLMTKEFAGISYDDDSALYVGAAYEPQADNEMEVLIVDTDVKEDDSIEVEETTRELEARAVARRIKQLVGHHPVFDKETGAYRPAKYKDIVILTRSLQGWTDVFGAILDREGIPNYSGSKEGYFETKEIRTLLDYLKILDNPRQDIPFVGILNSCFCGISSEELAWIKCDGEGKTFYEKTISYIQNGKNEALKMRLKRFVDVYEQFRRSVPHTAIHDLLLDVIEKSGYGDYISSLPAGEQRKANVDMLIEKAIAFERTSYKGLFHFVRYIEQLHKYNVDYGEANIMGEQADTVRMMSIHKSKGLEFPIVFVCGMSKHFNTQDLRGPIVIHPELGIGMDVMNLTTRVKAPILIKKAAQKAAQLENLAEELRVLYVALTRAKEKLILTGTMSDFEKKWSRLSILSERPETALSFGDLTQATSYFDWILPALYRSEVCDHLRQGEDISSPVAGELYKRELPAKVHLIKLEELVAGELEEEIQDQITREMLRSWEDDIVYDAAYRETLQEQFAFSYSYETEHVIKQKMTVSELKKQAYFEEEDAEVLFAAEASEEELAPIVPKFMQKEQKLTGASRGTAYHRVMELLDFKKEYTDLELQEMLREEEARGRMTKEMVESIYRADILAFLKSGIGMRMKEAAKRGVLKVEQPFVLGIDARDIYPSEQVEETVLVQGIVDVFFEEDGAYVVLDYKTDRVQSAEELKERYHTQLDYYARALEQLTGKRVKEKWIYSFGLKEEIEV